MATKTEVLSIGLIGCGNMGGSHAKQMAALGDIRLAAACDVDEAKAQATAEAAGHGARAFGSVDDLLAQPDIPAVLVATPNFTHKEIVLKALAAGKDVFCEKPMALTVADCDEMIAAAKQHGRKLMVGQVLRLMTVFSTVRRLVGEGLIGAPKAMRVLRSNPQFPRQGGVWQATWRSKRANTGGLLFEVNVHELDFMRAILGEASEVMAVTENIRHPERDYEDHAIVTVRFRNGGVAVLEASTAHAIGATDGIVTGEKGSISYNWGQNTVRYRLAQEGSEVVDVPVERDAGTGIKSELSSFAQWVLNGQAPLVTAEDGRRAVQLAEAAYRSAEEKRAITLD